MFDPNNPQAYLNQQVQQPTPTPIPQSNQSIGQQLNAPVTNSAMTANTQAAAASLPGMQQIQNSQGASEQYALQGNQQVNANTGSQVGGQISDASSAATGSAVAKATNAAAASLKTTQAEENNIYQSIYDLPYDQAQNATIKAPSPNLSSQINVSTPTIVPMIQMSDKTTKKNIKPAERSVKDFLTQYRAKYGR